MDGRRLLVKVSFIGEKGLEIVGLDGEKRVFSVICLTSTDDIIKVTIKTPKYGTQWSRCLGTKTHRESIKKFQ